MQGLDQLIACAGDWRGVNRLQDPNTGLPEASPTTATITPVLAARFVRIDYTWAYQGNAQEGSLLIGYETETAVATAYWIDGWHMGDKVMVCPGTTDEQGNLLVRGTFAAGDGPDWGWHIAITSSEAQSFGFVMHNVEPNGREWLAVEAEYTRV